MSEHLWIAPTVYRRRRPRRFPSYAPAVWSASAMYYRACSAHVVRSTRLERRLIRRLRGVDWFRVGIVAIALAAIVVERLTAAHPPQ